MKRRNNSRIVYASFTKGPLQRLVLPITAPIWATVRDLVGPDDADRQLVGVLDRYKSKWID